MTRSYRNHGLSAAALSLAATLAWSTASAQTTSDEGTEISITPYMWLAGVKGDIGAVVGGPPVAVDADFGGIFDNLSGAFMGKIDARHDRFGVIGDVVYMKVSADKNRQVGNVAAIGGELESEVMQGTLAAYWRAHASDGFSLDLVAGARYTRSELEADLSLNNRQVSGSADRDWWDPVIGIRGIAQVSPRFSLVGYADYGGFGVSSDSLWQVNAAVNCRFTDHVSGSLGYRYYSMTFSEDGFDYDAQIAGPTLGVTITF